MDPHLVDGRTAEYGPSGVPVQGVTEFATRLRCGDDRSPQFSIVVLHGNGERGELGYLVDASEWRRLCG